MYYPDEIIEEIRVKNDIVDVISDYVKLKKQGSSYFGLCPFHNEKSPSFSVSPGKQMYYCFGCGAGGNVYTFIMEYENYTFPEAVKLLADRAGVDLPEMEYSEEARKQADLKSVILEINKMAGQFYYFRLKQEKGRTGYDYLTGRGLTPDTIKRFGLGYSGKYSGDLYRYLKQKGYSDDILRETGLFGFDEKRGMYDKFWNRVMFPIMDVQNRVIGFGGRVMGDAKPKYLNSPETRVFDKSRNLYGLNFARTSRRPNLIVCEGYMDVIALHQAGFGNAVASLGTALTTQQAALMKRYTKEVLITYDSDEAGLKAALRAIPILKEAGLATKVVNMQPHKDPDEFIKSLGAEAFEERLSQARNSFLFEIDVLKRNYDMTDPESKTAFYREIAMKLLEFPEELERNNYMEAVADIYHIGFDNLRKLVNRYGMQGTPVPAPKPKSGFQNERNKEDGMKKSQKLLLTWLIEEEKLFRVVSRYITADDFTEGLYRTVAGLVYEQYEKGQVNPAGILDHFTSEEEHREVASLFNTKLRELDTKEERAKALKETIIRVKENSIAHVSKNLEPTDMAGLQRLVESRKALQDLEKLHISMD